MLPQNGDDRMMKLIKFTKEVVSAALMSLGMGCPYSQEYISVVVHFSPAALVLLQMVFLLTDVILSHSRVTGITGKLSISLPRLSK